MFPDESYTLSELADKLRLPSGEVEIGLRRAHGHAEDQQHHVHTRWSYDAVWQYVHTFLNHGHFAAWEHDAERIAVPDITVDLLAEITADWPAAARNRLARVLDSAHGSRQVLFMTHHILRIDPECPACGRFPRIVGYDGRQAAAGLVMSIYVCPSCGYLFHKR